MGSFVKFFTAAHEIMEIFQKVEDFLKVVGWEAPLRGKRWADSELEWKIKTLDSYSADKRYNISDVKNGVGLDYRSNGKQPSDPSQTIHLMDYTSSIMTRPREVLCNKDVLILEVAKAMCSEEIVNVVEKTKDQPLGTCIPILENKYRGLIKGKKFGI